jgi:hypothetical protein
MPGEVFVLALKPMFTSLLYIQCNLAKVLTHMV